MAVENFEDWIVSVDDHVIEPPDLWQSRLPERFKERGPTRHHRRARAEARLYEGKPSSR